MTKLLSSLLVILLASTLALAQQLSITPNRPLHDYAPGETIVFNVETPQRGKLNYRIMYAERAGVLQEGTIDHNGGVSQITYKSTAPAFLLLKVSLNGQSVTGGQYAESGVVVGRDQISALASEPADYDAFWQRQKAKLAAVPLDVQRWLVSQTEYSATYQFSAAQVDGRRVYGYYVVPKGSGPKPAALRIPPYGSSALQQPSADVAEKGNLIEFVITIHNAPGGQTDPQAYEPNDPRDPEKVYYRYAVLAAIRAIDVLATLPEWNQRDLLVYGDSQGGGLSFLTAGIDGRPTAMIQSIAALSQLNGELFDRPSGFPYYLTSTGDIYGADAVTAAARAVKYYDAIYAARRFRGPSLHYVNYLDAVCPPATHYAAYNAMPGEKIVNHSLALGHTNSPDYFQNVLDFARRHFPTASQAPFPWASKQKTYTVDAGLPTQGAVGQQVALVGTAGFDEGGLGSGWQVGWRKVSGPGNVSFAAARSLTTTASFSQAGTYVLELQVTDPQPDKPGQYYLLADRVTVTVGGTSSTSTALPSLDRADVFPNPANEEFRIEADFSTDDEVTVELYDGLGRRVQQSAPVRVGPSTQGLRQRLDVADYPAGTYTLRIVGQGGAYQQLLSVAH